MHDPMTSRKDQDRHAAQTDEGDRFFCQLFDDRIEQTICVLRKNALHSHDAFSCRGCSKEHTA